MFARIVFLAIGCIALTGCVPKYKPAGSGDSSAAVEFAAPSIRYGTVVLFTAHSTETCTQAPNEGRIAGLHQFGEKVDESFLPTGRRIFIRGHREEISDINPVAGGVEYLGDICMRLVSFVPEAGRAYRVELGVPPACTLTVKEKSTLASPSTLAVHEVSGRCAERGL